MKKPNIIYILADDMGYGDVSALNEEAQWETPNLDQLAEEGIYYSDAHSSSSVCTPSRYSILTGRYNWRSKLKEGVYDGYSPHLIEEGRKTVGSILKEQGYQTASVGKWHLGMDWKKNGPDHADVDFKKPILNGPNAFGFDYFYGISASLDMPPYVYIENDRVPNQPDRITGQSAKESPMGWWRKGPTGSDFKHEDVLPHLTNKVLDYLDQRDDDNPFFMYFSLPSPHTPILPSPEFQGKSGTNAYGDFVLMTDDVVGQVLNKLDEKGMKDNTIVIFTSDNGCSPQANFEELKSFGHNPSYIFRGHKADIFEGGHRVPLLVRWPEMIEPNQITTEPVCLTDLMATAAEITGYKIADYEAEDSVSHLPLWKNKLTSPLREALVHHSIDGAFSIRKDEWKLELCPGSGGWSDPVPGTEKEDDPKFQLYNLKTDVGETVNLVNQYPAKVEELKHLLTKYIKNGRSTLGTPQENVSADPWPGLEWLEQDK